MEFPSGSGGVDPSSMKDSHAESIWLLISFDLTAFPHIGHSTMLDAEGVSCLSLQKLRYGEILLFTRSVEDATAFPQDHAKDAL